MKILATKTISTIMSSHFDICVANAFTEGFTEFIYGPVAIANQDGGAPFIVAVLARLEVVSYDEDLPF